MRSAAGPMRREKRGIGVPRMIAALTSGGAQQRRRAASAERAQPAADARDFPAAHWRCVQPISDAAGDARWPSPPTRARAPARPRRAAKAAPNTISTAKAIAARRLPAPQRMIGHRLAPDEFALRVASSISPQWPPTVPSSARFQGASIGLDHVDVEFLALGQRQHVLDHARLVGRRRQRALAHAPGARPADLADQHLLAGKGGRHPAADRLRHGRPRARAAIGKSSQ